MPILLARSDSRYGVRATQPGPESMSEPPALKSLEEFLFDAPLYTVAKLEGPLV